MFIRSGATFILRSTCSSLAWLTLSNAFSQSRSTTVIGLHCDSARSMNLLARNIACAVDFPFLKPY